MAPDQKRNNMSTAEKKQFNKELPGLALPLALLGCFVFHWPVMAVYVVMCLDEIVKIPFISRRYRKFIWLKNLTRAEP